MQTNLVLYVLNDGNNSVGTESFQTQDKQKNTFFFILIPESKGLGGRTFCRFTQVGSRLTE